jgi:hypothetical protein
MGINGHQDSSSLAETIENTTFSERNPLFSPAKLEMIRTLLL